MVKEAAAFLLADRTVLIHLYQAARSEEFLQALDALRLSVAPRMHLRLPYISSVSNPPWTMDFATALPRTGHHFPPLGCICQRRLFSRGGATNAKL